MFERTGISVSFLAVCSMFFGAHGGDKYRFHLPWACSVLHGESSAATLIGAGTIFDDKRVLASVGNFNETAPGTDPPTNYIRRIAAGAVSVFAGSNFMNPELLDPMPPTVQKRKAVKFYVVFKPDPKWEVVADPPEVSIGAGAEFDVFGLAFDVGILEISGTFTWNIYVHPIPTIDNLQPETDTFISETRAEISQKDTCVTYSWSRKLNQIRYHEVMWLQRDNCLELFCHWKLSRCLEFPKKPYLNCFKATTFADVCPKARGAALYCPKFKESVFAVLTTAPSCGLRSMPGVYTNLDAVVAAYEKAYNTKFVVDDIHKYNVYSLEQGNYDYEGIDLTPH